jgi:hypothetical protein
MALDVETDNPVEPDLIAADTRLVNWVLHLPANKRLQVEDRGEIDEILFQAHMLYNTWVHPLVSKSSFTLTY